MDAAYRRTPTLIISRYGTRAATDGKGLALARWTGEGSAPIVKATGDPVNELGKWAVPRKSFFLAPGDNYIYNWSSTRAYLEWYDAVLL